MPLRRTIETAGHSVPADYKLAASAIFLLPSAFINYFLFRLGYVSATKEEALKLLLQPELIEERMEMYGTKTGWWVENLSRFMPAGLDDLIEEGEIACDEFQTFFVKKEGIISLDLWYMPSILSDVMLDDSKKLEDLLIHLTPEEKSAVSEYFLGAKINLKKQVEALMQKHIKSIDNTNARKGLLTDRDRDLISLNALTFYDRLGRSFLVLRPPSLVKYVDYFRNAPVDHFLTRRFSDEPMSEGAFLQFLRDEPKGTRFGFMEIINFEEFYDLLKKEAEDNIQNILGDWKRICDVYIEHQIKYLKDWPEIDPVKLAEAWSFHQKALHFLEIDPDTTVTKCTKALECLFIALGVRGPDPKKAATVGDVCKEIVNPKSQLVIPSQLREFKSNLQFINDIRSSATHVKKKTVNKADADDVWHMTRHILESFSENSSDSLQK